MELQTLLIIAMVAFVMVVLVGMAVGVVIWNTKRQQSAIGLTRQRQEEMLSLAEQSLEIHRENRELLREIRDLLHNRRE